jgi:hypothetical protein
VLRISTSEVPDQGVTLQLEGRLVGPWVAELRRICDGVLGDGGRLTLDLLAVSFVDKDGIALVDALRDRRVAVVNCSPFVAEQLRRVLR